MTLYLQMNGSTDCLITNFGANTTDKIVMDVLIDNPQLNSYAYLLGPTSVRVNNGNLQFGTGVTGYAFGTRTTLTIDIQANLGSAQAITSIFYRGTSGGGYNGYSTKGKIYDVKYYSAGVLVAHYDMSTGTVQDISGNGNHATLVGGTWVDDGAGGGSTGTTGSTNFDLKQVLYQTLNQSFDTRLQMYANGSYNADTKQEIYNTNSIVFDSEQAIFNISASDYDTEQIIFNTSSTKYDTEQTIYNIASSLFDTLQQITDGGIIGSTRFDTRMILYADGQSVYDTKQSMYQTGAENYDLKQAIYQAGQTDNDLKLVLFADTPLQFDTVQQIWGVGSVDFDTLQSIFDPDKSIIGTIHLNGSQTLNVYLVGSQELNVNLKGGVS